MLAIILLVLAAEPIPEGRSWVRRASLHSTLSHDGEVTTRWRTRCEPIDLALQKGRGTLRLGPFTFIAVVRPQGLSVAQPTLSSRLPPLELPGFCEQLLASVPVFSDLQACQAAPSSATRRCRGEVCAWEGAEPFLLPDCEKELTALETKAQRVLSATHAESLRTLQRLQAVMKGGSLFAAEPDADKCVAVVFRPSAEGRMSMKESHATRSGARVTYRAELTLEPLFHQARVASEYRSTEGPGGIGSSGASDRRVGLYLGRDVVLIGNRWLFFDQQSCDATLKPE